MSELKFTQANGLRFAYFDEGAGPVVLLVHGFPDTARTWDLLRPVLVDNGFRVVAPYMRGYAPTEIPTSAPNAQTLGEDLLSLLDACDVEQAMVVGHDWGALASYAAASLAPERVSKLLTAAVPHPGSIKPSLQMMWSVRHFFGLNLPGAAGRVRKNNFAYLETLYRRWSPTWDFDASELDAIRESLGAPGSAEAAVSYYHMMRKAPERITTRRIKVPTRSVAGADDPAAPPSAFENARRFFEAGYDVVTLAGGHFVHRESPDEFAATVLDWLR